MVNFTSDSMKKRDDFHFRMVNFPCLIINIQESPAYGVFVSQLMIPLYGILGFVRNMKIFCSQDRFCFQKL